MNLVKGPDFSYYDDIINWKLFDNDFAFIKCSEGTVIDKVFREQWREARGRTIRGAYHFFRSFVDPLIAARKFADYLDGDLGELPPVIDLEAADGNISVVSLALRFANEFRRITKVRPMFYSSPGFLNSYHAKEYTQLADYKLWMAMYPFDKITPTWTEAQREKRLNDIWEGRFILSFPPAPLPFRRISFLQFTGKGKPYLIKGYQSSKEAVDLNLYNGIELLDMMHEFNIKYIPKPDNGGPMEIKYFNVIRVTNIRNIPFDSTQASDIGDLPAGSKIETVDETIDTLGRKWYKLSKATNPAGGPIITTSGKLVSEVPAWCFGGNLQQYTPEPAPPPTRSITTIDIEGATKVNIRFDDGTTQTLP